MISVSLCGSVGVVAHARVRKVRVPLSKHPVVHRRMREGCCKRPSSIFRYSPRSLRSLDSAQSGGRHSKHQMLYGSRNSNRQRLLPPLYSIFPIKSRKNWHYIINCTVR